MEVGGKVVGGWEPPGRRGKGCLPCRQDSWLRPHQLLLNAPPTAPQYIVLPNENGWIRWNSTFAYLTRKCHITWLKIVYAITTMFYGLDGICGWYWTRRFRSNMISEGNLKLNVWDYQMINTDDMNVSARTVSISLMWRLYQNPVFQQWRLKLNLQNMPCKV